MYVEYFSRAEHTYLFAGEMICTYKVEMGKSAEHMPTFSGFGSIRIPFSNSWLAVRSSCDKINDSRDLQKIGEKKNTNMSYSFSQEIVLHKVVGERMPCLSGCYCLNARLWAIISYISMCMYAGR